MRIFKGLLVAIGIGLASTRGVGALGQTNLPLLGVGGATAAGVSPATFVQECHNQAGAGTTVTLATGSDCSVGNVTNGNTIYFFGDAVLGGAATLSSYAKTAGTATIGAVTLLDNIDRSGGGIVHQVSGWFNVTGSGSLTMTATWSVGITNTNFHQVEYSGTDTTTPVDQHTYTQDAGGACATPTNTNPSITTAKSQTTVLGFMADNGTDITVGSGWTGRGHQGAVSAFVYSQVEDKVQASPGAIAPTFGTSATDSCAQMTVGVKANGS